MALKAASQRETHAIDVDRPLDRIDVAVVGGSLRFALSLDGDGAIRVFLREPGNVPKEGSFPIWMVIDALVGLFTEPMKTDGSYDPAAEGRSWHAS